MGRAQTFVTGGASLVGSDTTPAPGAGSILDVRTTDIAPAADGTARKRVTVVYEPPDPVGTFTGYWVYLDAPDTAFGLTPADGTVAADGTSPEGGIFRPADMGYFAFDAESPQLDFEYNAPKDKEHWRVYLVAVSERRHAPVVQAGKPGASLSKQFTCIPPAAPFGGREYAPLITDLELVPAAELGQATNPWQETTEGGQQVWRVVVRWKWPTNDQNFQTLGGINIVVDDGTVQNYGQGQWPGNVSVTSEALYISGQLPLKPGTTEYTLYFLSYSKGGQNNQLVEGVTPSLSFSLTRALGAQGSEYAARVTADGVHPLVAVTPLVGADGTSLLQVAAWWTAPDDPQFGGVKLAIKRPSDSVPVVYQTGSRIAPLEIHISQPATVQTWRFYLLSVDANGRTNSVKDDGDGSFEAGETPWIDISVGNAGGQLNLAKAKTGTFADDLAVSGGMLTLGNVSATKIVTGILQVGGGGSKVSILKNFDTLGSLIGWVGDDTGDSGYVGAWFKQLRIGGASPAAAQITADAAGNVTISTSLLVGTFPASSLSGLISNSQLNTGIALSKLASGTLPGGIVYAGTILATQILAGTISVALTLTAPTIIVTSGLNTINLDAANALKISESVTGTYVQLTGGQLTMGRTGFSGGVDLLSRDSPDATNYGGVLKLRPTTSASPSIVLYGINEPFLQVGLSLSTHYCTLGVSGSIPFLRFTRSGASHYALWADNFPRMVKAGTVALSAGGASVSTGLASIAAVAILPTYTGAPPPADTYSWASSGGTLNIHSSNGGSAANVSWIAYGTP